MVSIEAELVHSAIELFNQTNNHKYFMYAYSSRKRINEQCQQVETNVFCLKLCKIYDLRIRIIQKLTF